MRSPAPVSAYDHGVAELTPNAEQLRAFDSRGHCVVLAGPGSGKTKLLTLKLARLLREEVHAPHGIACVTYNTECARELTRRLRALGVQESQRVFIGTLHAFCLRHILGPFARLTGVQIQPPFRLATKLEIKACFDEATLAVRQGGAKPTDLDRFRRTAVDAEDWQRGGVLAELARAYEAELRKIGRIDFQSIVSCALDVVENAPWVRRCLVAKFPILAVDEYQDLGPQLHRMVERLCLGGPDGARLFAVGDPDQSIYRFLGATPRQLRELASRADVEDVSLLTNYRSGTSIVAASSSLLDSDRGFVASRVEEGTVRIHAFKAGYRAQRQYLREQLIPELLRDGYAPGEIAILHPTWREGNDVEDDLIAAGRDYVRLGSRGAYPRTRLTRLVEDLANWCAAGWRHGAPELGWAVRGLALMLGEDDPLARRELTETLTAFAFSHRDLGLSGHRWLSDFEAEVIVGLDAQIALADLGELEGFQEMLNVFDKGQRLATSTLGDLAGQGGSPNHLNLVTLHSSKGTEFDVCVVIRADADHLPGRSRGRADRDEKKRLFYVALSRARYEAHILCSEKGHSPFLRSVLDSSPSVRARLR